MSTFMRSGARLAFTLVGALGFFLGSTTAVYSIDVPHDATKLPQVCNTCHIAHVSEPATCGGACPAGQHPNQTTGVCEVDQTCPGTCAANEICTIVNGVRNCQCPPNRTGAGCTTCAAGYSGATCTTASTTCASVGALCAANNGVCAQTGCGGNCAVGSHNRQTDGVCVTDETCPGTCNTTAGTCSVVGGVRVCSCGINFVQDGTCSSCAPGYANFPTCSLVACTVDGASCANGHGTCNLQPATCTADCPVGQHNRQSDGVCVADETCPGTCNANQICTVSHSEAVCTCPIGRTGATCGTVVAGYSCTGNSCTPNVCAADGQACGNGTCAASTASEFQACADNASGGKCVSSTCTTDGLNIAGAVGGDCAGRNQALTFNQVFTTQSPSATLFNVWIRLVRDADWDAGEQVDCSLTGVGGATVNWTWTAATLNTGGCTGVTGAYCWAKANNAAVSLDTGNHTLNCSITTNANAETFGFDGIIYTRDTAVVPNATATCASDAEFTAGTCVPNWGPNVYSLGGFTCGCAAGYTGALCNSCAVGYTNVNGACVANASSPCNGQTCSGQGTCFLDPGTAGGAVCDCIGTYSGATPLACNVCNATGGFVCGCGTGYTGADCASCLAGYHKENGACVLDPDDCSGVTCDGRGTCSLMSSGTGMCDCNEKFYGTTPVKCDACATPTLSCQCKTGYTGATCSSCAAGYHAEGGKCEANSAGVCAAQICNSHGTCYPSSSRLDLPANATCACTEHFYGNVPSQCDQCASTPQAPYLLNNPNGINTLCLGCHSAAGPGPEVDTHWGSVATVGYDFTLLCSTCHDPHTQPTPAQIGWSNVRGTKSFLRKVINTPNSGSKTITFNANTGADSWADGASPYDGICEVCHTLTTHHRNSTSGGDHTHNAGAQCTSCHNHNDDSADNLGFKPKGDCEACHAQPQPSDVATARRNILNDFNAAGATSSHHIQRNFATAPISKFDCVICHLEGDATGSLTSFHNDAAGPKTVNLRDVDNAANTAWTFQDTDVIDNRPNGLIGAAQLTNMTRFCVRCHDGNGVADAAFMTTLKASDTALGASRSATVPFADATSPPNVNAWFNPSQYATHSISSWWNGTAWASGLKAPFPNKGGTTPRIRNAAFVNSWVESYTTECSDCHQPGNATLTQKFTSNAHASQNTTYMLNTMTGADAVVVTTESGATASVVCLRCHALNSYVTGVVNSKYPNHNQTANHIQSTRNWLGSSTGGMTGIGCFNCHGGDAAGSIHGENRMINNPGFTTVPANVFLTGAGFNIWVGNGELNCGGGQATAWNLNCSQHSGGAQNYTRAY